MNLSKTKTDAPPQDVQRELAALEHMTTTELCHRYEQLHGQPTRTRHRQYLIRKIAWRIQANAEGDLSERARRRAEELANDADVRVMPPRTHAMNAAQATVEQTVKLALNADPRLGARLWRVRGETRRRRAVRRPSARIGARVSGRFGGSA